MNKRLRQAIAVLLAVVVVLGLAAGCRPAGGSEASSGKSSSRAKESSGGSYSSEGAGSGSAENPSSTDSPVSSGAEHTSSAWEEDDEEMEETDMTIRNAFVGYSFDSLEGWNKGPGASSLKADGGSLHTVLKNSEAALVSPSGLKIPAQTIRTIEFRLCSAKAASVKVYWKTENGGYSEENSASVSIHADNRWHDYQIELSLHEKWTGTVDQLKFAFPKSSSGTVYVDYLKLTGLYFVPFVMLSGNAFTDKEMLAEMKAAFANSENTAVIGFSAHLEFLSFTNAKGDYEYKGNLSNPEYFVMLAKATEMPVMMWLRGDPWGYQSGGVYNELWSNDAYCMWTADNKVYRSTVSGYGYLCMADKDLNGRVTRYWAETEKLLDQCSEKVNTLIQNNPGCILGVTTSSEIKFNANESDIQLDYNPKAIKEFRDWCSERYKGDLNAFNTAMKTSFTTWSLLSADYNPSTIENAGGFDAPRSGTLKEPYWSLWTEYRRQRVGKTVKRQVEIIAPRIDSKYIYTHQIDYNDEDKMCSPIETANVPGSNVGIDTGSVDVARTISSWLKGDYSRSWGIPEIFYFSESKSDKIYSDMRKFFEYGVKYFAPLAWGDETYTVEGSEGEAAWSEFLHDLDRTVNYCTAARTDCSGFQEGYDDRQLVDALLNTAWSSPEGESSAWITVDLAALRLIGSIVLYPDADGAGLPAYYKVEVSADNSDTPQKWTTVAEKKGQSQAKGPQTISFKSQNIRHIRVSAAGLTTPMRLMELKAYK